MSNKKHDIEDPLERAATLGVIGGGKTARPVTATPVPSQVSTTGKDERGVKEKRARKGQYVYLPPDLIRYLKYQAADRDLEISEVVEEAIREHKDRHQG